LFVRESAHLNGSGVPHAAVKYMWHKATFNMFKLNLGVTALVITVGIKSEEKIVVKCYGCKNN